MRSSTSFLSLKRVPEFVVLLALMLLGAIAVPGACAQESAGVKSDPQVNVEVPNRSVDAVDWGPEKVTEKASEKAKEDAAGRADHARRPYSTWGIHRPTDEAEAGAVNHPSTWTLQSKPVSTTTANDEGPAQQLEDTLKPATRPGEKTRASHSKPGLAKSGLAASNQKSGSSRANVSRGAIAEAEHGSFDPAAALTFDPMRNFSGFTPSHAEYRRHLSHSEAEEYCHAAVSDEIKRLCAQSQKKTDQHMNSTQSHSRDASSRTKF